MLSWNIAGWSAKSREKVLDEILRDRDVILLQETWATLPIEFEGFSVTSLPARKSAAKGRPAGGLAILVKPVFKHELLFMADSYCKIQAIKLRLPHQSLMVINVYMPPVNDKAATEKQWVYFSGMFNELTGKFPSLVPIISADFNARVGQNNDIFHQILNLPTDMTLSEICFSERQSKDRTINAAGLLLAKFCITNGLTWLNGLDYVGDKGEYLNQRYECY